MRPGYAAAFDDAREIAHSGLSRPSAGRGDYIRLSGGGFIGLDLELDRELLQFAALTRDGNNYAGGRGQ
jgi:hypothetical protein